MRLPLPNLRIRTRIALTVSAVSIGLLVLLAVTVYAVFDRELQSNLDSTLGLRAESNLQLVDLSGAAPALQVASDPGQERLAGEAVLRLYASDGSVLQDASPATGMTGEERTLVLDALAVDHDVYRTIDLGDDEDYRVVASRIDVPDSNPVVL